LITLTVHFAKRSTGHTKQFRQSHIASSTTTQQAYEAQEHACSFSTAYGNPASCHMPHKTSKTSPLPHKHSKSKAPSSAFSNALQLHCFTASQNTILKLGIPPFILRQAEQLLSLHFRYTGTHTHLISIHLYTLKCQREAINTHPKHSLENRIEKAYHILRLSTLYP